MNILYIGDVMGEAGIKVVEKVLPVLKKKHQIDFVVVQAENVSEGKGLTVKDYDRLKRAGIQAFTGGNWTLHRDETEPLLEDPKEPITRPANYPEGTAGQRYKIVGAGESRVALVSLLGSIVGKDSEKSVDNPLLCIDVILKELQNENLAAIVVNFHGDYSSEKRVIGHYLDGRVSAVVGDHWHVPTADAMILPHGTAHITDVGMCGSLDSSLGIKFDSIVPRWRDGVRTVNELESDGAMQFNAVLIGTDSSNRAKSIMSIQQLLT